jgi:hypothetical protein
VRAIRQMWGRLRLDWRDGLRVLPCFTQPTAVLLLGVLVASLAMIGGVVALVGWPGAGGPTRLVPGERAGQAPVSRPEPAGRSAAGASGAGARSGADAGGVAAASPSSADAARSGPAGGAGAGRAAPGAAPSGGVAPGEGPGGAAAGAGGSGGAAGAGAGGPARRTADHLAPARHNLPGGPSTRSRSSSARSWTPSSRSRPVGAVRRVPPVPPTGRPPAC